MTANTTAHAVTEPRSAGYETAATSTSGREVAPTLSEAARAWSEDALAISRRERWPIALMGIAWIHLAAFLLCQWMDRAELGSGWFLAAWGGETAAILVGLRAWLGRGWAWRTPLASLALRLYLTLCILMFNAVSLNVIFGMQGDGGGTWWFKLTWVSLSTYGLMAMAYVSSIRFFYAAVIMFFAGLLMAWQFTASYAIFGAAWWIILHAIAWQLRVTSRARPGSTAIPTRG